MATIEDVAALAGVSAATVSRVLNNNHMVSQSRRDRVLGAVKALNYRPNALGRNLRRSETKMVMVACTAIFDEAMKGIQDVARELDYDVIVNYIGYKQNNINSLKFLENGLADGVIFLNNLFDGGELIDICRQYPTVQSGEYIDIPNSCWVSANDFKAAYDMTEHLIRLGRKRIGIVAYDGCGMIPNFAREREKGFKSALDDYGMPFDPELRMTGDCTYNSGVEAANQFLGMKNRPDAVFCTQDNMAVGCVNAFAVKGISIPDDIAVAGFDNAECSEICNPPLTTVAMPYYEIGREAMRILVSLIKGETTVGRQVYISHKLIIRGSTVKT